MRTTLPIVTLLSFLGACSGADPIVVAEQAGGAYFPANSRSAVNQSVRQGVAGIEVDVVVTADGIAFLHDGPTLDATRCEGPVSELPVASLEATSLDGVTCGGRPDPAAPDVIQRDEPLLTLSGFLELVRSADDRTSVWLHVHPGPDQEADDLADAVLGVWFENDAPQPLVVFAEDVGLLASLRFWAASRQHGLRVGWIPSTTTRFGDRMGATSLPGRVEDADVDAVQVPWTAITRETARVLRARETEVVLTGFGGTQELLAHQSWPADALLTPAPVELP